MDHRISVASPVRSAREERLETSGTADESDEELMLAYAAGRAEAFERLYSRHRAATYRYFLRHTSDRGAAEELHQDLWLKVVRARGRYAPSARFGTWLYTLARHRLIDHWRSRRGAPFADAADDSPGEVTDVPEDARGDCAGDDPLTRTMDAETGQRLLAALGSVPAAQRDAFLMHVEAGLSLGEIAEVTGVPPETVKSRLRYAYRKLRTALEDLR